MSATRDLLTSGVPDTRDVPFDEDLAVDDEEYADLMRRIGPGDGEPSVSAFNSSI